LPADRTGDRPGQGSPADDTVAVGTSGAAADQTQSGSAAASGSQTGPGITGTGANAQQSIQQAAVSGMAEVQLGRLAEQRASSSRVKEFARMMVKDHSKANDELKQVARGQNIQLPTQLDQKHQDLMMRLQQLRGAEFDREYMRAMVDDHMEARDLLSRSAGTQGASASNSSAGASGSATSTSGGNSARSGATVGSGTPAAIGSTGRTQAGASFEQWAGKNLPTIEQHLQQAQQINSSVGSGTTPSSPSSGSGSGTSSSSSGRAFFTLRLTLHLYRQVTLWRADL